MTTAIANTDNTNILSPEEAKQRLSLERRIDTANKAWHKIGTCAAAIRDLRLYRSTHATGDAYFADRFDYTRQYVAYVIAAARIYDQLKGYGFSVLPKTESQCRPFNKVPEDMQYDANVVLIWQKVVDSGEKMTAKLVTKVVDETIREYVSFNYDQESALYKQWAKKADTNAADQDTASGHGTAGATDQQTSTGNEAAELRAMLREAKAKIAHLESALAAEREAHKRTATAKGKSAPMSKLATDLYKAGYKAMAKQHHPSMGGSTEAMQELNNIKDALGF